MPPRRRTPARPAWSQDDGLQRVVAGPRAPGHVGQAVGLEAQGTQLVLGDEAAAVHHPRRVAPVGGRGAPLQPAGNGRAEIDVALVKPRGRVVELVHQAVRAHGDAQPGFLGDLAGQIVGQGLAGLHPAARGAPQIAPAPGPGVDQQKPPVVQDHGAHGEADGTAGRHGLGVPRLHALVQHTRHVDVSAGQSATARLGPTGTIRYGAKGVRDHGSREDIWAQSACRAGGGGSGRAGHTRTAGRG